VVYEFDSDINEGSGAHRECSSVQALYRMTEHDLPYVREEEVASKADKKEEGE
jgi:hypothetical protein